MSFDVNVSNSNFLSDGWSTKKIINSNNNIGNERLLLKSEFLKAFHAYARRFPSSVSGNSSLTDFNYSMPLDRNSSYNFLNTSIRSKIISDCVTKMRETGNPCEETEAVAFRYIFPIFLILSVFGNSLTLAVYNSKFLKNASTVILLATKALANLAGICFLSMEMVLHYCDHNSGLEEIIWYIRPYTLFLANFFGTLAVW